jgi:type I restriction enzyme M protein
MAQVQKIGYDVKGQPIYRCNAAGKLLRTSSGQPIIDDDVEKISGAYAAFKQGKACEQDTPPIYTVAETQLNSRLDVEHYLPSDQEIIAQLLAADAKHLGQLAEILTETDDFRSESETNIRYIAISDVDARTMQVVSQQAIKAHEAPSRATYRVRTGDIITAISGASTGTERQATALITADEDGAICSNGFAVLRHIHGIEPLFLLTYMRTEYYLRQVRRLMTGHAIPAISTEDLGRVLVAIPPVENQKRIANDVARIQAMRKEAHKAGGSIVNETAILINQLTGAKTR